MAWFQKYRKVWEFIGLVIVWPALAYFVLFQAFTVDEYHRTDTGAAFVGSGLAIWIALRLKRK